MDTWRISGDCLDSKLMADLKVERSSASVGTGKADAAQLVDVIEAGGPAETNRGTGARRSGLTVFVGGRLALHVAATRGAAPARVGRLRLITVDGKRVGHAALGGESRSREAWSK